MKSQLAASLAGLALAASAAVAQAPAAPGAEPPLPPQYEVEVIVFANREFDPTEERFEQEPNGFDGNFGTVFRDAPIFDDTTFDVEPPPADPLAPIEPLPPEDPIAAQRAEALSLRPLPPEQLKLGNEYRRLRAVAAYTPIVHAGWVQPGLPETESKPFDLAVLGTLNPTGTIRVHLSRFLHITLDLTYRADGAAGSAVANDGLGEVAFAPRYHLKATRSARSGELHYFDHPAFGVLVRVTPVPSPDSQGRRPAA